MALRLTRASRLLPALLIVLGSALACSPSTPSEAGLSATDAEPNPALIFEVIADRNEMLAGTRNVTDITQFLENTYYRYVGPDGTVGPPVLSDRSAEVVVGRIIDVQPGRAYEELSLNVPPGTALESKEPSREAVGDPERREVDFGSADASWRTIHLTVQVDEALSGSVPNPVLVGLSLPTSNDFESIRQSLLALESAVFILYSGSDVFAYDRSIRAVADNGALIAPIATDGTLSLPAINDGASLLGHAPTVAALRQEASGPGRVVTVKQTGKGDLWILDQAPRAS